MHLQDHTNDWFAINVKPRMESYVASALSAKGYDCLLPTFVSRRRWADRIKSVRFPLFPGYLFCRITKAVTAKVVTTPGVIRVVGCGKVPVAIGEGEIEALKKIEESGVQAMPWPRLQPGDAVQIVSGPLSGISGLICRISKRDYIVVSVTLLQRSALVELKQEWVAPPAGGPRALFAGA